MVRIKKGSQMNGKTDARRLTLPVTVFGSVVAAVFTGTWWLSSTLNEIVSRQTTQSVRQMEIAASLTKIDGRTEAFPVLARRVDSAEQSINGLTNGYSQMQLDVRTLQIQIDEVKRTQTETRADVSRLNDWQRAVRERGGNPQP